MTETNAVAVAAKILISRVRKHIEEDKCSCCRRAIRDYEAGAPTSPEPTDNNSNNPTAKLGVLPNDKYDKGR